MPTRYTGCSPGHREKPLRSIILSLVLLVSSVGVAWSGSSIVRLGERPGEPGRAVGGAADGDLDGIADGIDVCPDVADPDQVDGDGDGVGDACDPFPTLALRAVPVVPDFAVSDAPVRLAWRLEDADGALRDELSGARVGVALEGLAATVATTAAEGLLVAGAGTAGAVLEFVAGRAAIDASTTGTGPLDVLTSDPERQGIEPGAGFDEDFEVDHGGFEPGSIPIDSWEYGIPSSGPLRAASGERVWATRLAGPYPALTLSELTSPWIPLVQDPVLRFRTWHWPDGGVTAGRVEVSTDGIAWTPVWQHPDFRPTPFWRYDAVDIGLDAWTGQTIRIRFAFRATTLNSPGRPGWYVDDVTVTGTAARVGIVDPSADDDGDGLSNADEIGIGSRLDSEDSDGDGVDDGIDLCPTIPDADQADLLPPLGVGDACQDSDTDGIPDVRDVCPTIFDSDQADDDDDGVGDACDPLPNRRLSVEVRSSGYGTTDAPAPATWRLLDDDGRLAENLDDIRVDVAVTGSAIVVPTTEPGAIVAGAGTGRATIRFAGGLATVGIASPVIEIVELRAVDVERTGIVFLDGWSVDFEDGAAGFTSPPGMWSWGVPPEIPAYSGRRVIAAGMDVVPGLRGRSCLASPPLDLDDRSVPTVELRTWLRSDDTGATATVDTGAPILTVQDTDSEWVHVSGELRQELELPHQVRWCVDVDDDVPLWLVDDVAIRGVPSRIRFLDPDDDDDGDGAGNGDEITAGSAPTAPDPDGDEVLDPFDNCPWVWNGLQGDLDGNGMGDACQDSDGDAVLDVEDNCPSVANPLQANADGDAAGDACDPYPDRPLRVRPGGPSEAFVPTPVDIVFRLEDAEGTLHDGLAGIRVALTLSGSATFGQAASQGLLHAGGGTNRVEVEFVGGLVALPVVPATTEFVRISGEDIDGVGLEVLTDRFDNFEFGPGEWSALDDVQGHGWQHGTPTTGAPGLTASGDHVWSTNLGGGHDGGSFSLTGPPMRLPSTTDSTLEFQEYFDNRGLSWGRVQVSDNDGLTWITVDERGSTEYSSFEARAADLSSFRGRTIRLRFAYVSVNDASYSQSWTIDDVGLDTGGSVLRTVDLDQDVDADGLSTGDELAVGADPFASDSDRDGVLDGDDNCPVYPNSYQGDVVHPNGIGDACDDPDADGVADYRDNCPDVSNPDQADEVHPGGIIGDGGDACDDPDADGTPDSADVCPDTPDPDQIDGDGDGVGDACDSCPATVNPGQEAAAACVAVAAGDGACFDGLIERREIGGAAELALYEVPLPELASVTFEVATRGSNVYSGLTLAVDVNGHEVGLIEASPSPGHELQLASLTVPASDLPVPLYPVDDSAELRLRLLDFTGFSRIVWVTARFETATGSIDRCLRGDCGDPDAGAGSGPGPVQFAFGRFEVRFRDPLLNLVEHERRSFDGGAALRLALDGVESGRARLCLETDDVPRLAGFRSFGDLYTYDERLQAPRFAGSPGYITLVDDPHLARAYLHREGRLEVYDLFRGAPTGESYGFEEPLRAAVRAGDELLGLARLSGRIMLVRINLDTGTLSSLVEVQGNFFLLHDPVGDILYGRTYFGDVVTIDRTTGATQLVTQGVDQLTIDHRGRLLVIDDALSTLFELVPESGAWRPIVTRHDGPSGPLTHIHRMRVADCVEFDVAGQPAVTINGAQCGPPVADAGPDLVAECVSAAGATIVLDGSASTDPDSNPGSNDDIVAFEWLTAFGTPDETVVAVGEIAEATLPFGTTTVTLLVTDSAGATDTDEVLVEIADTRVPTLALSVDPRTLWPPNHRLATVTATVLADDACGPPAIELVSVTSSEPDDAAGGGDGATTDDVRDHEPGTDDREFRVRAERAGDGPGRRYYVRYRATDRGGNAVEATDVVVVPHDPGSGATVGGLAEGGAAPEDRVPGQRASGVRRR